MKCVSPRETLAFLEGVLEPERAAALRAHFERCPRCAAERDRLAALAGDLAPDAGEFDAPGLADDVLELIRFDRAADSAPAGRGPARLWAAAAAGLVLLAAGALGAWWALQREPEQSQTGFVARGGAGEAADRWVSFTVYRATGPDAYERVERAIRPHDELAFAYRKRARAGLDYLMILGVDAAGRVFWYYPPYSDPQAEPRSRPVADAERERPLPDRIGHRLRPGRLRLFAVFSARPLAVERVERVVAAHFAAGGRLVDLDRLELPHTGQQLRRLVVEEGAE